MTYNSQKINSSKTAQKSRVKPHGSQNSLQAIEPMRDSRENKNLLLPYPMCYNGINEFDKCCIGTPPLQHFPI
jgi:hypothetical protein